MGEESLATVPFDRAVEQAIVSIKKGAYLLKCGRRGKPKFCPFRLFTYLQYKLSGSTTAHSVTRRDSNHQHPRPAEINPPFARLLHRMASAGEDFSQFDISKEEKDKLVAEVIRYVLFKTHQNLGCPIKRDELTQLVTKNYRQRALPSFVINEAKEKLSSIFGYEMRELQRSRPSSANQGRSSQQSVADAKSYVLISQLPADVYRKYVEDVNTTHLTGFTFVILSVVYLAGGKIPEENLWHHLRRMGLSDSDEIHPVLGNVKQALETLVQQRYLQKDKVSGPEGNTLFYELAERALDGPVNERVKEYISQTVKKDATSVDVD